MNTDSPISLTFVRDRVKAFYDIMDTKKDAYIDLKILDAVREMQSSAYVTQEAFTLEICDHKAKLPCNYKTVLAVVPPCTENCATPIVYSEFYFDGVLGNCQWIQTSNKWKIMDGWIVFPSNFTYETIDIYCDVYILGEDGFPVLKEAHVSYYERYANYWVGLKLGDARYKAFSNYSLVRRHLIHNEQVDNFNYNKLALAATIKQMGIAGYTYMGTYGSGLISYGVNGYGI